MLRDNSEGESLATGIQEMEDDGDGHGGAHTQSDGSGKNTDCQKTTSDDLGSGGRERPEGSWAGEEAEELGDDVGGESVDVLDLVKSVVDHKGAGSDSKGGEEDVRKRIEKLFLETGFGEDGFFDNGGGLGSEGVEGHGGAGSGEAGCGEGLGGSGGDQTGKDDSH